MNTKHYFIHQAPVYAAFRPTYPDTLYDLIRQHIEEKNTAWDCATGNGQVAGALARFITHVQATDVSREQLAEAIILPNISYSVQPAEQTDFPAAAFDLITVGQALHWFNLPAFFQEVKRTAKPGALLAVFGYSNVTISPEIDTLFERFYNGTVGPFWDEKRRTVERHYADVSFPFQRIATEELQMTFAWTLEHFTGYLRSWSATQKFIKARGFDPVDAFAQELEGFWSTNEIKTVAFPLFVILCRI